MGAVLVTGSGRGIGAATVRLLGQRGHGVAVNYLRRPDSAEQLVAEVNAAAGRAIAVQADISDAADVQRLFERVNAVMPGLIDTEIHAEAGVADRLNKVISQVPMDRIGTPGECAEAIVWLLSGEAAYMTGAVRPLIGATTQPG